MRRTRQWATALVVAAGLALAVGGGRADAIIGGTVSDPADYPYFVKIDTSTGPCGASVIDASWVLTAAHCVQNDVNTLGSVDVIRMAAGDPYDQELQRVRAVQVIPHPLWDWMRPDQGHDLALVRLPAGALAGVPRVQVGIPWQPETYLPNTVVTAMGYGAAVWDGPPAHRLLAVDTILRSDEYMTQTWSDWAAPLLIGAGTTYQNVCMWDSGGPLVLTRNGRVVQLGVVNFGVQRCNRAAAFAELAGPQLAWIASQVPAIVPWWDPCVSPYGTLGQSVAYYGPNWAPGVQADGLYYWSISCSAPGAVVPALRGMYQAEAIGALVAAGLHVGTISRAADPKCQYLNRVMRQSPSSGTQVAPGSAVDITIGTRPRYCQ